MLCSGEVRKSIARVLTVYNQTRKASLRAEFKNSKYLPLDLRPKLTRALRRRLTPTQVLLARRGDGDGDGDYDYYCDDNGEVIMIIIIIIIVMIMMMVVMMMMG